MWVNQWRLNLKPHLIIIAAVALTAVAGEKRHSPVAKGARTLSIETNMNEAGDFNQIFRQAARAGNEAQVLAQDWNELETAPGQFAPETNFFAIANFYYPPRKMPIHLSIRPIHTNQKVVPADLSDKPLDDPEVIQRFKHLIDWLATQMPNVDIRSIAIGSEVDIFAWGDPSRWRTWIRFYGAVAPYMRIKFPGVMITSEVTYAALVGPNLAHVRKLHQHSDAVGVSYYPMKAKLKEVKPPHTVHGDFEVLVKTMPKKPIIFYQIGYPSSPLLDSSLEKQAQFMIETFRAWDTHSQRIIMLNFQWMHETPDFGLDHYANYYQHDTPQFRAFLGSLGLKAWSGNPKPAWKVMAREAKIRGFGLRD